MLRNSFIGAFHPILSSRIRSGWYGGRNENTGLGSGASNNEVLCCNVPRELTRPALLGTIGAKGSQISLDSGRVDHAITMQAASTIPNEFAGVLPDDRTSLRYPKTLPRMAAVVRLAQA